MEKRNRNNRILFVGLNTIDIQYLVADYPEENTKNKAIQNQINAGGPATNAAVACACLGSKVDLLTPIGKHIFSEFIHHDIEQFGIRFLDPIFKRSGSPVFSSIVTSRNSGERTVFYYQPKVKSKMFYNNIARAIGKFRLAMFDGFFGELAIDLAQKCRQQGVVTVLDGGSWKDDTDELLGYIDIAICSGDFHTPESQSPDDIFIYLHARGVQFAAITRGEKSILYSCLDSKGEIPVDPVVVVDTLGAGDIFHGAFCHYYASGQTFTNSLRLASTIAGRSCKSFGTRRWMNDII